MFTEILNIVVLLAKPTVVIVIVQAANCCYCSDPLTPLLTFAPHRQKTLPSKTLPFFIAVASDGRARAVTDSPSTSQDTPPLR